MTPRDPFRVLLADDVRDLRFLLKLSLERTGRFNVVAEATTGVHAIELAEMYQPDLVLLDVAMPELDGLEALPRIREVAPNSVVVILSGFQADTVGPSARDAGAVAVLEKGIRPQDLVHELLAVLDDTAA